MSSATRVEQRGERDCVRAAMATYLGVPYESTPSVDPLADRVTFWPTWNAWLADSGRELCLYGWAPGFLDRWVALVGRDLPMGHVVVMAGTEVWHDPHPPDRRVTVRRPDFRAALVVGELGATDWREAISAELRRAAATGDERVWRIERLVESDWAVQQYRLRGEHDLADAMAARLNEME